MVYVPNRAQPSLEFIPPDLNTPVLATTKALLPLWLSWHERIRTVETTGVDTLARLFQQFQAGETRFLLAFRHPSPADPYCLAHLLWYQVPEAAQALGLSLQAPIHAHFLYDRGIPLWAGKGVGWLCSKLGGTPIQRGKVDRQGLRSARSLFVDGQFPLAASPEGGNNGHTEVISPLEPGIAQLGFWCVEDLQKANRQEQVLILPVGIRYRYLTPPWAALEQLLTAVEEDCGMTTPPIAPAAASQPDIAPDELAPETFQQLYARLYRLGEHLLDRMEGYYQTFFDIDLESSANSSAGDQTRPMAVRLEALLNAALQVAEDYFQLVPKGSVIDRCRRIEQAGWERIFRQEIRNINALSPVDRGLADRIAEEANLRMWHMRLVENFVAVTGKYVQTKPTAERFAETLLLLRDTTLLIQGRSPFPRPKLGDQQALLQVGEPISVSQRGSDYRTNRRRAVDQLTQDLRAALEAVL